MQPPAPTAMESVGSNSPPANTRYSHTHHVAGRITRALRHRLRLLHRSRADFFILGATGNVYTVTLSAAPSCTCPDRTVPCKHILFVYLRVLRVPFGDASCLMRRTLRPCQLARLLCAPTAPDVLAGDRARERFHQLFSGPGADRGAAATRPRGEGEAVCPVCLEEMDAGGGEGGGLATCATCGNSLHGECLTKWRRSRGRRAANCVVCRARWRERREQERYVNLAAYVSEEDDVSEGGDGGLCAG